MEEPRSFQSLHGPQPMAIDPGISDHSQVEFIEQEADQPQEEFRKVALLYQFRYSLSGLFVGVLFALVGLVMGLKGVAGATSWTTSFLGLQTQINDAIPGVVLALIGFFVIYATRFQAREKPRLHSAKGAEPADADAANVV